MDKSIWIDVNVWSLFGVAFLEKNLNYWHTYYLVERNQVTYSLLNDIRGVFFFQMHI